MAWCASYYMSFELMTRMAYFKKMAIGWRVLSFMAVANALMIPANMYASQTYGPLIGAYLRKYQDVSKNDLFEITDRKREFYQIDTSQYMNYTED